MRIARLKSRLVLPAALLATVLVNAAPASANVGEKIIDRCTHGESLGGFSQGDYTQALKEMSADTEEYSDCSSLIRQAQLAAAAGGRGTGNGGGAGGGADESAPSPVAVTATPSEKQSVTHAAKGGSAPVQLDGQTIAPGVVHTNVASAFSALPTPLLATLAFLLTCMLLIAGVVVRNRVRGRHGD
jgi:hypothetical protein